MTAALLAAFAAHPADAQRLPGIPPAEQKPLSATAAPQFPAFAVANPLTAPEAPAQLKDALDGVTVWGNVVYARSWDEGGEIPGVTAYTLSGTNLVVEPLVNDQWIFANGSGAFYDGTYHMISKGYTSFLYCEYNVDTWRQEFREESVDRYTHLVATDCDYDPVTGLVYGCFWNPAIKNYEFAAVDYESCTHTTIAPMEIFSAIAINSKGVVYGIKESDGCLYTIDKTTGEQKLIGPTGIQPYLLQSAAFDRSNDALYWAVRQTGSIAYLATVNTDTGSARRLAYFPDGEQVMSLYIPRKSAPAAPAKVKSCTRTTDAATSEITLGFTLPTLAANGVGLGDNSLSYTITLANEPAVTATAAPGAAVSHKIAGKPGYNTLTVTTRNAAGESAPLEMRVWCGLDTPRRVSATNVNVKTVGKNNTVTVSWTASDLGIHNGYIGKENMTFDVVRMPAGKTVASGISATSFTEELGDNNAGVHYYTITPHAGDRTGETVATRQFTTTGTFSTPWTEPFDESAAFDNFMTVDSNADGVKWVWNEEPAAAKYLNGWKGAADDWLLTPEIALTAGQYYELSFDVTTYSTGTERLAVAFGRGTDPSKFTELLPTTDFKKSTGNHQAMTFSVAESGNYRVAFHCTSPSSAMYLLVDNIAVTDGPAAGAPDKVSALTVTPDATGLLKADVSFTAPTCCVDPGIRLDRIARIDVMRDSTATTEPIATFTSVEPGATLTLTDDNPVNGYNAYTVVARTDAGAGLATTAKAFVGQDRPYAPTGVTLSNTDGQLTLSWSAPRNYGMSADRHPVITEELTYNVYTPGQALLKEGVKGLSFDIPAEAAGPSQGMRAFHVTAVSPGGESPMGPSNSLLTGKPYEMPLHESFPGGYDPTTFWWVDGYNVFIPSTDKSYDNDGGCIRWRSNRFDKTGWYNSGMINISPARSPMFTFAYWLVPGKQFKLTAYIAPDGGENIALGTIDFAEAEGEERWQLASFDLTPYTDSKYVLLKIYHENSEAYVEGYNYYVYLDQLSVTDPESVNLRVASINAPATLYNNQTAEISVAVENAGLKDVGFSAVLYANGEEASRLDNLTAGAVSTMTATFSHTPDIAADGEIEFTAEIVCESDPFVSDNRSETVVTRIIHPEYPTVDDLRATKSESGAAELTWSEPAQDGSTVTETFEDYLHTATSFGSWTTIDLDLGRVYTNQVIDVGFHNVPMSWAVFNTIATGITVDDEVYYGAHSGETALLAIASQPTTIANGDRNDDWLISPELSVDQPHHVEFWAKSVKGDTYGYEQVELLWSAGFANKPSEFVSVDTYTIPQEWTLCEADIPAGARHFAIRYISRDLFYLLVDDIEYTPGVMTVKGYNVFRDGVKIASTGADATGFTDEAIAGSDAHHVYTVTTVYNNGESLMSNAASTDPTALDAIGAEPEGPFDVYSVDGCLVRRAATSTRGLARGIYIVNNRKVVVR